MSEAIRLTSAVAKGLDRLAAELESVIEARNELAAALGTDESNAKTLLRISCSKSSPDEAEKALPDSYPSEMREKIRPLLHGHWLAISQHAARIRNIPGCVAGAPADRLGEMRETAKRLMAQPEWQEELWKQLKQGERETILVSDIVPLIVERRLDPADAEVILRARDREKHVGGLILGTQVSGDKSYEVGQAIRDAAEYLLFLPLVRHSGYRWEDFKDLAGNGIDPLPDADVHSLQSFVIGYCDARKRTILPTIGDPLYWLHTVIQCADRYNAPLPQTITRVVGAISLAIDAAEAGRLNNLDALAEEVADIHQVRQLQGIVFELRKVVRTGRRSSVLEEILSSTDNPASPRPVQQTTAVTKRRRKTAGSDALGKQDVFELKKQLAAADLDDATASNDAHKRLKLLLHRIDNVAIHVYQNEGSHQRPHFHVVVKGVGFASIAIDDLTVLEGDLNPRLQARIFDWAARRLSKLRAAWDDATRGQRPLRIDT